MPWVRICSSIPTGRKTNIPYNSDAEGVCLTQAAFDQAHRAVDELMKGQVAWWNRV